MQTFIGQNPDYDEIGTLLSFSIQNKYIYLHESPSSRSNRYLYAPEFLSQVEFYLSISQSNSDLSDSSSSTIQAKSSRSPRSIRPFDKIPEESEGEETIEFEVEEHPIL